MVALGPTPRYRAWVLRCWEATGDEAGPPALWRFSLEDPHTRERRGFADLESLLVFVRAELAVAGRVPMNDPP